VPADASPSPAIYRVMTDLGGTLGERKVMLDYLRRAVIEVQIVGTCASACEWFETLPKDQICFWPNAWIGRHTHNGEADDTIAWRRGRDAIAAGFRECRR
jgi:hypothetical protein